MEANEIYKLMWQMAAATKYLAEKKVIHRDIKPSNIFVTWSSLAGGEQGAPTYKLGDFGCVSICEFRP